MLLLSLLAISEALSWRTRRYYTEGNTTGCGSSTAADFYSYPLTSTCNPVACRYYYQGTYYTDTCASVQPDIPQGYAGYELYSQSDCSSSTQMYGYPLNQCVRSGNTGTKVQCGADTLLIERWSSQCQGVPYSTLLVPLRSKNVTHCPLYVSGLGYARGITTLPCALKITQTLQIAVMSAQIVGSTLQTSVYASSRLSVTLLSLSPSTCSVSNNQIRFLAAGECVVTFRQEGNDIFEAAEEQRSISVTIPPWQETRYFDGDNCSDAQLSYLSAVRLTSSCAQASSVPCYRLGTERYYSYGCVASEPAVPSGYIGWTSLGKNEIGEFATCLKCFN